MYDDWSGFNCGKTFSLKHSYQLNERVYVYARRTTMKYYMVFVCIALASFNFKSNCFPSRQSDNPCHDKPNGSFLHHPLGCKYFIVCNNGELNTLSCPDGMAFNPLRPPCDQESNVDCSQFSTTQSTTTHLPTTQSPTTQPTTTTIVPTSTASTTLTTTIPTTISSTTQSTTQQTTTTTPTSTTTSGPTTTSSPTTTRRTTSTTITNTPPLTSTTVRPVTPEMPGNPEQFVCPDEDPNEIVFLASNTHCSKYYICYHNKPIEMTCSPNLHWNIKTQKCDSIEETKCTISTMPSFYPVCPRDAIGIYPHPLNCEWFLYCYYGHMTVQQCPFFYNWDRETQSCRLKTVAKCVLYSEQLINIYNK